MEDVRFVWKEPNTSVGIATELNLPFNCAGITEHSEIISLTSGNYSKLSVDFKFDREVGYYCLHVFMPSMILVILSWLSMFIHPKSPTRLTLLVLVIVSQVSVIACTHSAAPNTAYFMAIDVYLSICLLMILLSFFGEFPKLLY